MGDTKEKDELKYVKIVEFYMANGTKKTVESFQGLTQETLNRYKRKYRAEFPEKYNEKIALLLDNFSDDAIDHILSLKDSGKKESRVIEYSFDGEELSFLVISDTHIGSIYFEPARLEVAFKEAEKQKCSFAIHGGDIVEGLMNRPDSVYETTHFGFTRQRDYALDLLQKWKKPMYLLNGNHDLSFNTKMSAGVNMAKEICERLDNAIYIGDGIGKFDLNSVKMSVFHGADSGSSYAISYRLQGIINNFSSEQKPQILISGHDHKSFYMFYRNVHALAAGCLQKQTGWMSQKRLIAMEGFWIVKMHVKNGQVNTFNPVFYPFYV